jgi:ubiquitin-protein ligase
MEKVPVDQLLRLEISACHRNCPKTIIIQPSLRTFSQWQVYLMPTKGFFKSAILTFAIYFNNYPKAIPQVTFQTGVFHPLISHNSSSPNFDLAALVPDWNVQIRVFTILNAIYEAFIDIPVPPRPANPEAAALLRSDREAYARKVLELLPRRDGYTGNDELDKPVSWTQGKEQMLNTRAAV